jgi:hypothetical protein
MRPQDDRAMAEMLFVCEGKSPGQIAALVGANRMTIWRWAREGNWKERRSARWRESPRAALDLLKRQRELQIATITPDKPAAPEVIDALHKLNRVIEQMEEPLEGPDAMLDVMGRFTRFIMAHGSPEAIAALREWLEKFLNEERRRYGGG